jgi:hypothetical protein
MNKLFGRDPVVIVQALIVPVLLLAVGLFGWTENTVGVVQAAILAVGGFVAALGLSKDAALAALSGVVKAILALMLTFEVPISEGLQTFILGVVAVVVSFFGVRPQVEAKVQPINGSPRVLGRAA